MATVSQDEFRQFYASALRHCRTAEAYDILQKLRSPTDLAGVAREITKPILIPDATLEDPRPGYDWLRAHSDAKTAVKFGDFEANLPSFIFEAQVGGVIRNKTQDYFIAEAKKSYNYMGGFFEKDCLPIPQANDLPERIRGHQPTARIGNSPVFELQIDSTFHQLLGETSIASKILFFDALFYRSYKCAMRAWLEAEKDNPAFKRIADVMRANNQDPVGALINGYSSAIMYYSKNCIAIVEELQRLRDEGIVFGKATIEKSLEHNRLHLLHVATGSMSFFSQLIAYSYGVPTETQIGGFVNLMGPIHETESQQEVQFMSGHLSRSGLLKTSRFKDTDGDLVLIPDLNPNALEVEELQRFEAYAGFKMGCPALEVIRMMILHLDRMLIKGIIGPHFGIAVK